MTNWLWYDYHTESGLVIYIIELGHMVQVMDCLFDITWAYCWLIVNRTLRNNIQWNFESKYQDFHSRKCIWKCYLQNISHFVYVTTCQFNMLLSEFYAFFQLWEEYAFCRRGYAFCGRGMPSVGRSMPSMGGSMPSVGGSMPSFGGGMPSFGGGMCLLVNYQWNTYITCEHVGNMNLSRCCGVIKMNERYCRGWEFCDVGCYQ